jgi:guanidinoacetate N-methyltransferase
MKNKTHTQRANFPKDRQEWRDSPARFTSRRLEILGHSVMEDWEREYMRLLASIAASRPRRILEVGFGMGISAGFIQEYIPDEHLIIEANRMVYDKLLAFAEGARGKVEPILGFWEDVTGELEDGSVSAILFDTYPLSASEVHRNHFPFFREAYRLLENGGILTYYSDEETTFSSAHLRALEEAGFRDIRGEVCRVSPPPGCDYWQKQSILAPIIFKGTV